MRVEGLDLGFRVVSLGFRDSRARFRVQQLSLKRLGSRDMNTKSQILSAAP